MSMIHPVIYISLLFFVFLSNYFPWAVYGVYIVLLIPLLFQKYTFPNFSNWKGILWGIIFSAIYFPFISSFWSPGMFSLSLSEEIFFRAYLQHILTMKLGVLKGIISSSLLFTLPHLIAGVSIFSVMVFFPSLIFGLLYHRFKNVWTPTIFHYFSNLFFQENISLLEKTFHFWFDFLTTC